MNHILAFGMPAGFEWIIILVIALLIFGPKLPSVMRGLGGSLKEFKKGMEHGNDTEAKAMPPAAGAAPAGSVERPAAKPDQR